MKKFILIILLINSIANAQDYKLEDKTVTSVFKVKEKTKSEIFSSINKWISINYNSDKNVVQLNDLESGTIIIKGVNEASYKNTSKELYPNNIFWNPYTKIEFNHLIEINIKDAKFRIIYKITDIAKVGYNNLIFKCVSFNEINDTYVNKYNDVMEHLLKKNLVGKAKREKFKTLTKPKFEELSSNLLKDIKSTMQTIEKSISETKKDW